MVTTISIVLLLVILIGVGTLPNMIMKRAESVVGFPFPLWFKRWNNACGFSSAGTGIVGGIFLIDSLPPSYHTTLQDVPLACVLLGTIIIISVVLHSAFLALTTFVVRKMKRTRGIALPQES